VFPQQLTHEALGGLAVASALHQARPERIRFDLPLSIAVLLALDRSVLKVTLMSRVANTSSTNRRLSGKRK
jgi:hypothetical protein